MTLAANSAIPIGYRKKVARDGAPDKHAAGVVFVAPDGDILLLRRSNAEANYAGHWALPGGGMEDGEQPEDTARREAREELGVDDISDDTAPMKPLDYRVTPTGMAFHTFVSPTKDKFVPKLNDEHSGYAWASLDKLPGPMHPAVAATLKDQVGIGEDMKPEDWAGVRDGFLKWTGETDARDCAMDSALRLALDRDSVRTKDGDGRLRVATTNISKANVCPYRGEEIPGWEALGLEPARIYHLLRDPKELKKAADSLNGVPLLRKHIPVSAEDHQPMEVVGSLGSEAEFDGEYLKNSLFVNARDAIDGIESGAKRELSAGYHYTPDMTPGNFRGTRYDGVMRDLRFNHVALVEDGRAGPDVMVGDSMENLMKPTRLAALTLMSTAAHIAPRLAMDIALPKSLFLDITSKNIKDRVPLIADAVKKASAGKLIRGMAADEGGLTKLLTALEGTAGTSADESASEEQHKAMEAAASGKSDLGIPKSVGEEFSQADKGKTFDAEAMKDWLRGKGMGEDDINEFSGMMPDPAGTDEDPDADEDDDKKEEGAEDGSKEAIAHMREQAEQRAANGKGAPNKSGGGTKHDTSSGKFTGDKSAKDTKDMVSKPAMDAALKKMADDTAKAVRATEAGIRSALHTVKPYVGELDPTMAFDSASDVLRHTLKMLSVDGAETAHVDALPSMLKAQQTVAEKTVSVRHAPSLALDASVAKSVSERFPELERFAS